MIDYHQTLDKLFALHTLGIKLGLDNIKIFLDYLGNPQNSLKCFHIAGSNGKGSTSAFIASILQEKNYRVGLYTSPHFVKFNERIKINNVMIDDDYIVEFINMHEKFIDQTGLTFFEVTTAIAFQYFSDMNVDFAVIETGLGGRLDATNVLEPVACVITSISLEHTNVLGNSIEDIAFEKSEIIKSGAKVFIGRLPAEAENIIINKCRQTNTQLFKIDDYTQQKGNRLELYTEEVELIDWVIPLKGNYQKYNAALAGLVVTKSLQLDDHIVIKNGIKEVISNTGIQGRYEYFHIEPTVLLDSAHNPEGVNAFIEEFSKEAVRYEKKVLLFGVMRDKEISFMMKLLIPVFDEILITKISYERSADIEQLSALAIELGAKVRICNNPVDCVQEFLNGNKKDCLVVLGSMYLLGEIKSSLSL
ncbi:MAG: folylpolyglutamate synthase/dihydrofolate synthase family protein [Ignavibacteriaceae bacterium]